MQAQRSATNKVIEWIGAWSGSDTILKPKFIVSELDPTL